MADIFSFRQSAQTEVEIIHPLTNKPVGIKFLIISRHTAEVKNLARQMADKRIASARKGKPIDTASLEDESLDLLVAAVKGWDGVEDEGKPIPCTAEKVREILSTPGLEWIRKQVDDALGNDALFFQS